MIPALHYVYMYFRLDGVPCYVGKGKGDRWLQHEKRCTNKHLWALIQQAGGSLPKVKLMEGLTNDQAQRLEVYWIRLLGRLDLGTGSLCNFTDGGEGTNPSQAQREAIRQSRLGTVTPMEVRVKQSVAKLTDPDNNTRLEKARAARGPETPERAQRRREGQNRRWSDPQARLESGNKTRGRNHSPEACQKMKDQFATRDPAVEAARVAKIKKAALAQQQSYREKKAAT